MSPAGCARASALVVAIAALALPAPALAAAKHPPGAVKLAARDIKKAGKVTCGRWDGDWAPGTAYAGRWFTFHSAQAARLKQQARKAKGAKRKKLLEQAKRFASLNRSQTKACARLNDKPAGQTPAGGAPQGPAAPAPLRFNLNGAAALALAPAGHGRQVTDGSNLEVVTDAGQVQPAVTQGSATIQKMLIAPNGKLYATVSATSGINDAAGQPVTGCTLAEVEPSTGVPTCIDHQLTQIGEAASTTNLGGVLNGKSPLIQFDSQGAVYYTGYLSDPAAGAKGVLRRYLNGTTTDLITDNVSLSDFLVEPDGSVLITGMTKTTGAQWTRRVTAAGGLQNITNEMAVFLADFPDGNSYFGLMGGVKRLAQAGGSTLESKWWIHSAANGGATPTYNDTDQFCPSGSPLTPPPGSAMCGGGGGGIYPWVFNTTDGNAFGVLKSTSGAASGAQMFELFPTLAYEPTLLSDIKVALPVVTNVVMSGLNGDGKNVTTLLNTSNGHETTLIGPDDEIEVYHVDYRATGNKVMFDGLRFSDNKYVIGQVGVNGGTVSAIDAGTQKWADLQAFG